MNEIKLGAFDFEDSRPQHNSQNTILLSQERDGDMLRAIVFGHIGGVGSVYVRKELTFRLAKIGGKNMAVLEMNYTDPNNEELVLHAEMYSVVLKNAQKLLESYRKIVCGGNKKDFEFLEARMRDTLSVGSPAQRSQLRVYVNPLYSMASAFLYFHVDTVTAVLSKKRELGLKFAQTDNGLTMAQTRAGDIQLISSYSNLQQLITEYQARRAARSWSWDWFEKLPRPPEQIERREYAITDIKGEYSTVTFMNDSSSKEGAEKIQIISKNDVPLVLKRKGGQSIIQSLYSDGFVSVVHLVGGKKIGIVSPAFSATLATHGVKVWVADAEHIKTERFGTVYRNIGAQDIVFKLGPEQGEVFLSRVYLTDTRNFSKKENGMVLVEGGLSMAGVYLLVPPGVKDLSEFIQMTDDELKVNYLNLIKIEARNRWGGKLGGTVNVLQPKPSYAKNNTQCIEVHVIFHISHYPGVLNIDMQFPEKYYSTRQVRELFEGAGFSVKNIEKDNTVRSLPPSFSILAPKQHKDSEPEI